MKHIELDDTFRTSEQCTKIVRKLYKFKVENKMFIEKLKEIISTVRKVRYYKRKIDDLNRVTSRREQWD